jgi:hypothetical protein
VRASLAIISASALLAAAALSGCAVSTTQVTTVVDADATVPPILLIQIVVTSDANPALTSMSAIRSQAIGDAADRPAPFLFPLALPVSVDESFAGAVTITMEGLDWDTQAVIARGSTGATVVARQTTQATLTLTAVSATPGPDGGGEDGGAADASGQ